MKTILKTLAVFLLLVLSSGILVNNLNAQTMQPCPSGHSCTVYIWINGIYGISADDWSNKVIVYGNNYRAAHNPPLDPTYVVFDSIYNQSGWKMGDLAQSATQLALQATSRINLTDPDLLSLIDQVRTRSSQGYKVVLVGHSQGTFYTNFAYEAILNKLVNVPGIPSLPDNSKLVIVNIASPANNVADGNGMYTTLCGDIILGVPGSLPADVHTANSFGSCTGWGSHPTDLHELDTSYLVAESQTQKQIYADFDLALGLPDPGCNGDANCYLKDNFVGSYITNWRQFGNDVLAEMSTVSGGNGTLKLTSYNTYTPVLTGTGISKDPAHLSLRTRRVFTGPFTMSFQYNSTGTGKTLMALANASTNTIDLDLQYGVGVVSTYPDANSIAFSPAGWHTLTFIKTDSLASLLVDGKLWVTNTSTPTTSYYLGFDLQGNNTLQIQNLSVVRGATTPSSPTMTLTPTSNSLSVVQGNSVIANLTLASQNGMTGIATIQPHCVGVSVCPTGFGYSYATSVSLPANSSVPLSMTFYTTTVATPGVYNFDYQVTLNGVTAKATIAITVTAKIATTSTMTLTPATNNLSIVQGSSGYVDLTLNSQNGMTGTATIQPHCLGVSVCPTGFGYSYPTSVTLPANGPVPLRMTFYTTTSAVVGTYNYDFQVTLGGKTVTSTIIVVVTAPTPTTPTIIITPTANNVSIVRGSSGFVDLTLTSKNGATGTATIQPHCLGVSVCPTGFTYSYATSVSLSANGTVSLRMTFYTTTSAAPGTYNYDFQVTLSGKTVVSTITVIVTAPTTTTGTIVIMTNGTVPSVSCAINGASFVGPGTFANQATGSKTISCTPPTGFTLTSITPSATQTLSAGGTVTFIVNLTSPTPVLSGISVVTNPKVNTNITVYLTGSGFVNGMLAYTCTSASTSSCSSTPFTLVSGSQVNLYNVRSSVATTLYLRVTNSAGVWSNYLTMVVIN
jgi:hypothetical protein